MVLTRRKPQKEAGKASRSPRDISPNTARPNVERLEELARAWMDTETSEELVKIVFGATFVNALLFAPLPGVKSFLVEPERALAFVLSAIGSGACIAAWAGFLKVVGNPFGSADVLLDRLFRSQSNWVLHPLRTAFEVFSWMAAISFTYDAFKGGVVAAALASSVLGLAVIAIGQTAGPVLDAIDIFAAGIQYVFGGAAKVGPASAGDDGGCFSLKGRGVVIPTLTDNNERTNQQTNERNAAASNKTKPLALRLGSLYFFAAFQIFCVLRYADLHVHAAVAAAMAVAASAVLAAVGQVFATLPATRFVGRALVNRMDVAGNWANKPARSFLESAAFLACIVVAQRVFPLSEAPLLLLHASSVSGAAVVLLGTATEAALAEDDLGWAVPASFFEAAVNEGDEEEDKEKKKKKKKTVNKNLAGVLGNPMFDPTVSIPAKRRKKISLEEFQKHNTRENCWVIIDGCAFDLTNWIPKHPGGVLPIVALAGKDATDHFHAFHPADIFASLRLRALYRGEVEGYEKTVTPLVRDYRTLRMELESQGLFESNLFYFALKMAIALSLLAVAIALTVVGSAKAMDADSYLCRGASALLSPSASPFPLSPAAEEDWGLGAYDPRGKTWAQLLGAFFLGFFFQQVAFLGHDLGHNGVTHDRFWDQALGVVFGPLLTGISIGWWKKSHNTHHTVPNSLDYDQDVQYLPLFALSDVYFKSIYSFYHKRVLEWDRIGQVVVSMQHYLYYPIMAVARINLYVQAWIHLATSEDYNEMFAIEVPATIVFLTYQACLLYLLPSAGLRVAYVLLCNAVAGLLHVQITLSHFGLEMYQGVRFDIGKEGDSFAETQLKTTQDVECT